MGFKICDTNVLVAANGRNTHADINCQISCTEALTNIKSNDILILDRNGEIISEYVNNINFSGQPGVGDAFFKHIFDNQSNPHFCLLVDITRIANDTYAEVPRAIDEDGFDKSDQKFVAAAISSGENPPILNATDSDWYIHREQLGLHGINVQQLCPQHQDKNN